ncbi:MAG: DUF177 domain-containing protein [Clostridia bacterium]|nr:DUF177 domain-containing protein [Clostridia bacterium]
MEIQVKKLNAAGKYSGDFEFEYTPQKDVSVVPMCKIEGAVSVKGSYEIYRDDSVGVNFTVDYRLSGKCSYCLEPAEKQITFVSDVLYVPENDDENYYYDGIKINLTSAVDDAILISQPAILLCKEDCKGIDVT